MKAARHVVKERRAQRTEKWIKRYVQEVGEREREREALQGE